MKMLSNFLRPGDPQMPQWHSDQGKHKITGGKRKAYRTKRRFESGRYIAETQIGERDLRVLTARGSAVKLRLLSDTFANITVPGEKRTEKAEILRVVRNPVSADYDRRRVITRGAVIATKLGEAVVSSRPGQDGVVNALLLKNRT
jgi:small subunit ribosomal protein S8e